MGANVHNNYIEAKKQPHLIKYVHDTVRDVTEKTHGFLIFQEQIALLAHQLGKDISLDEGNLLRKVLTKKGTGKEAKVKRNLFTKFITGCMEKGLTKKEGTRLWETFEYFSGYGFNKSHAISYCFLSYQCAWLLNYYPAEWMAAFLIKNPKPRKKRQLGLLSLLVLKFED